MAYSFEFKAKALTKLAQNKNDYDKVAEEMGVSKRTLYRWTSKDDPRMSDFIEEVVKELLENQPQLTGQAYANFIGILLDKLLLLRGEATSRTEEKSTSVSQKIMGNLSQSEYEEILEKALEDLRNSE